MNRPSPSRQRGTFTIIAATGAALLITVLGFVVDASRMMVNHGELQTATDACALAAAAELNGREDSLDRAREAGKRVGTGLNKKNFQSSPVQITDGNIRFNTQLNGDYELDGKIISGKKGFNRFVECSATHDGWVNLFMGWIGLNDMVPSAISRAGLQKTRKVCALPLALMSGSYTENLKDNETLKIQTQSNLIWTNLRFSDLPDDEVQPSGLDGYNSLIENHGTCGVSTDLNKLVSIYSGVTQGQIKNAVINRFSSDRKYFSIPMVSTINNKFSVQNWICLEMLSQDIIYYHGSSSKTSSTNAAGSLPASPCVSFGLPGVYVVGPFAPVLIQ